MDDSKHSVEDSEDGWALDSEYTDEKESEIVSESDGNAAMLTVKMWAFLSIFSCPTQTALLLAPILLGPGEATHSESFGT